MALPQGRLAPVLIVACLLLAGWVVVMPYVGTNARQPDKPGESSRGRDQFAAGAAAPATNLRPVPFDGKRALAYIRDLCKLGPRISGTDGMKKQQELVKQHFEMLGPEKVAVASTGARAVKDVFLAVEQDEVEANF